MSTDDRERGEPDPEQLADEGVSPQGDRGPAGGPPPRVGRRTVTTALGAIAGAVIAGCGDDETSSSAGGGGRGGGGQGGGAGTGAGGETSGTTTTGSTTGSSSTTSSSTGGAGGEGGGGGEGGQGGEGGGTADACSSTSDLTPQQLLGAIDTIVVLCMENRSFDHYLGALTLLEGRGDVDGLVGTETNPDGAGSEVPVYLLEDFTPEDPPHGWDEVHAQWAGGANDGFVTEHEGPEVMGYHVRDQLPITYALADAGAVCDRFFCSVLGPTWPNRFYLHGGTSQGITGNTPVFGGFTSIQTLLEDAGLSFNNFYHDVPWRAGGYFAFSGNAGIEDFFDKAAQGSLPHVSIIDPQFFGDGANDDHPDHHIHLGQALIASVYEALAQSPQWGRCLFILTYDEHGGFFDHVPPPAAADEEPDFQQLGFRVPTIVAGPFVRRGCAVSTVFDFTSILKTIAVRWGLPNLTERMAAAADMSSCIDPAALGRPNPPVRLPEVPIILADVFGRTKETGRPRHHAEIWDAAESGRIPRWQDRRAEGDAIALRVLEAGERLGAVRVIR